ncbi:MAG: hypothetical protein WCC37_06390 [Candidatus Sulfotelmatobacter sp.]
MLERLGKIAALQIVTVALLGAVLASSAGATCLPSVPVHSSSAGSRHRGCHPDPVAPKSRSHDMRCCVNSPARALPVAAFSPPPSPHTVDADPVADHWFAWFGSSSEQCSFDWLPAFAASGGPTIVTALRI